MFALGNEEAGVGVPEDMKPHPGQPGSPEGREEASIEQVGCVFGGAFFGWKH